MDENGYLVVWIMDVVKFANFPLTLFILPRRPPARAQFDLVVQIAQVSKLDQHPMNHAARLCTPWKVLQMCRMDYLRVKARLIVTDTYGESAVVLFFKCQAKFKYQRRWK